MPVPTEEQMKKENRKVTKVTKERLFMACTKDEYHDMVDKYEQSQNHETPKVRSQKARDQLNWKMRENVSKPKPAMGNDEAICDALDNQTAWTDKANPTQRADQARNNLWMLTMCEHEQRSTIYYDIWRNIKSLGFGPQIQLITLFLVAKRTQFADSMYLIECRLKDSEFKMEKNKNDVSEKTRSRVGKSKAWSKIHSKQTRKIEGRVQQNSFPGPKGTQGG